MRFPLFDKSTRACAQVSRLSSVKSRDDCTVSFGYWRTTKMLLHCSLALLLPWLLSADGVSAQRRPSPTPFPSASRAASAASQQQQQTSDILEQISDISPDGRFHTKWVSANGISFEESGQPKSLPNNEVAEEVQGSASWTSIDGQPVSLSWHADENGAVFQGDHVPTAPPVPLLIQRALDYIAANPPKTAQEGAYVADAQQLGPSLKPATFQPLIASTRRPGARPF